MKRRAGWVLAGAVLLGGCGGPSGRYGGPDCPFEMDFRAGGKVYLTVLGTETQGRYEVDGQKVTVHGAPGPATVFTRRGDRLEARLLGAPLVCRKLPG